MTRRFTDLGAVEQLQALSKFKDDVLAAAREAGLLERKRGRRQGVPQPRKRTTKARGNGKATEASTATN